MSDSVTPVLAPPHLDAAPPAPPIERRLAWHSPISQILFWTLVIGGVGFDLWSKEWAFHELRQDREMEIVPYLLKFQTAFNSGALFGIGRGMTELFLGASVVALLLVFTMFARSLPRQWMLHIALGAIRAGALGNMYDRAFVRLVTQTVVDDGRPVSRKFEKTRDEATGDIILREYPAVAGAAEVRVPAKQADRTAEVAYVRDFIKINSMIAGKEIWPWVFNIADMLLVGGVSILALKLVFERHHRPEPAPAPAA